MPNDASVIEVVVDEASPVPRRSGSPLLPDNSYNRSNSLPSSMASSPPQYRPQAMQPAQGQRGSRRALVDPSAQEPETRSSQMEWLENRVGTDRTQPADEPAKEPATKCPSLNGLELEHSARAPPKDDPNESMSMMLAIPNGQADASIKRANGLAPSALSTQVEMPSRYTRRASFSGGVRRASVQDDGALNLKLARALQLAIAETAEGGQPAAAAAAVERPLANQLNELNLLLERIELGRQQENQPRHSFVTKENIKGGIDSIVGKLSAMQVSAQEESHIVSEPLEQAFVWLVTLLFTISTIVLAAFWKAAPRDEKSTFVTSLLTCAIAAGAYYAKVTGNGDLRMKSGTIVPLARYVDWIATTPLMMYELCRLGGADISTMIMIIGCDLVCLSFGLMSACLDRKQSSRQMLAFFCSAGFFYVFMMFALQENVAQGSALEQPQWVQDLFFQLQALTAVSWSCYPIVVFLGRAECQLITKQSEDLLLVFLDMVSKLGMEALILVAHINGHAAHGSSGSSGSSSASGSA